MVAASTIASASRANTSFDFTRMGAGAGVAVAGGAVVVDDAAAVAAGVVGAAVGVVVGVGGVSGFAWTAGAREKNASVSGAWSVSADKALPCTF